MQFVILRPKENILNFMRRMGYHYEKKTHSTSSGQAPQWAFVRPLAGRAYPKFHVYLRETTSGFELNLHLDQKAPSYRGTPRHGGEYQGAIIEQEAQRIIQAIQGTMNNKQ